MKKDGRKKRRDEQHHNILQNCLPGVTISTSMTSSIRSSDDETAAATAAAAGGVATTYTTAAGHRSTSSSRDYLPSNYLISPTNSISSNDTSVMSMESSPLLMMPSPSSSRTTTPLPPISSSPLSSSLYYVDVQDRYKTDPSIHLMILEERERRQRHYTTKRYVQGAIFILVLFVLATWNNNNNNNNGCTHWCGNIKEIETNHPITSSTPPVQQVADTTTTTKTNDYTLEDDDDSDDDDNNNNNNRDEVLHILKNLDEEIDGDIVLESTKPKFIEATKVWQQHLPVPFVVIEPHNQNDVTKIVPILTGLTRDYSIPFRIRSGGHNYGGYSTINNSGIVLSLRNLNSTTIQTTTVINNATMTTILVEPGVTVEQFLQTTLADSSGGLASVVADAAGVGMVGFVLGGGYNFMSRKYGLGIDNVVRFKVVLTNGTTLSVQHGDDLFWALRGSGGGNFGIVTEMEYQLHKMEDMKLAGHVKIPFVKLPQFLFKLGQHESKLDHDFVAMVRGYERYQQQQPQHSYIRKSGDVSGSNNTATTSVVRQSSSSTTSAGNNMMMTENGTVSIKFYWAGDADPDNPIGEDYIKKEIVPLLPKTEDDVASGEEEVDYYYYSWSGTTRQKEQDKSLSSVYAAQSWNGFMFAENNTDIVWQDIRENLSVLFKYCTPYLKPKIELWGGAIANAAAVADAHNKNDNGTTTDDRGGAFPFRQALFNVGIELYIPDGTDNAKQVFQQQSALIGAVWPSIAQYLQGVYVNFPMPSLTKEEYPTAYWGNNLERLQKLKDEYDPYHVLTYEQSIPTIKSDDNTNSSSKAAQ